MKTYKIIFNENEVEIKPGVYKNIIEFLEMNNLIQDFSKLILRENIQEYFEDYSDRDIVECVMSDDFRDLNYKCSKSRDWRKVKITIL